MDDWDASEEVEASPATTAEQLHQMQKLVQQLQLQVEQLQQENMQLRAAAVAARPTSSLETPCSPHPSVANGGSSKMEEDRSFEDWATLEE